MPVVYRYRIQDGENEYEEFSLDPNAMYGIDGSLRAVKSVDEFEATEEEVEVLRKFGVVV